MTERELEALRERAYKKLKPGRIPHVKGVEAEAASLALRWGESEEDARVAGILHDVTKKKDLEGQLKLCEKYGIVPDKLELKNPALLHSKTGAMIAKYKFGVSERVESAIRWHTTGRAGMNLLEKIVYLADMIEPSRSFEGVDDIRRLAYEDLDMAMLVALKRSMTHVGDTGAELHPNTVAAYEDILNLIREKDNEAIRKQ